MRRKRTLIAFLIVGAIAGLIVGVFAGNYYYQRHLGDWRIGVTAFGIGAGAAVSTVIAVVFLWVVLARAIPTRAPARPSPVGTSVSAPTVTPTLGGSKPKPATTNLIDIISALGSIGAGIYLLQYHAVGDSATGTSWFEIIGHGMGIYFIAKGLFIGRTTFLQAQARNSLAELVDIARMSSSENELVRKEGRLDPPETRA